MPGPWRSPARSGTTRLVGGVVLDALLELGPEPAGVGVDPVGDEEAPGAAAVVVTVLPDPEPPPPEVPPPPLDGATGVTPGQAWAKAAAGDTEGFAALGLAGPGSW